MDNKQRRQIYKKQNGDAQLTEKQKRRLATKRALARDKAPKRPK